MRLDVSLRPQHAVRLARQRSYAIGMRARYTARPLQPTPVRLRRGGFDDFRAVQAQRDRAQEPHPSLVDGRQDELLSTAPSARRGSTSKPALPMPASPPSSRQPSRSTTDARRRCNTRRSRTIDSLRRSAPAYAVQARDCRYIMQIGDGGYHAQMSLFPKVEDSKTSSTLFDLVFGYTNRTTAMTERRDRADGTEFRRGRAPSARSRLRWRRDRRPQGLPDSSVPQPRNQPTNG